MDSQKKKQRKPRKKKLKKRQPKKYFFTQIDFDRLIAILIEIGFEIETEEIIQRDVERYKLTEPSSDQIRECKIRLTLRKDMETYRIVIKTSFNPETMVTTRTGSGAVFIKDIVLDKRLYFCQLYRSKNFIDNLILHAKFCNWLLTNRPPDIDNPGELMSLHQTAGGKTYWKGIDPKNKINIFKDLEIPDEFKEPIDKHRELRDKWEKGRKALGITYRRKDRKKTWKKGVRKKKIK